jgi:hypothetical protein
MCTKHIGVKRGVVLQDLIQDVQMTQILGYYFLNSVGNIIDHI